MGRCHCLAALLRILQHDGLICKSLRKRLRQNTVCPRQAKRVALYNTCAKHHAFQLQLHRRGSTLFGRNLGFKRGSVYVYASQRN